FEKMIDDFAMRARIQAREIGVAHDSREEVVEIVGDASGEETEALEFLSFEELAFDREFVRLGLLSGGHIDRETFEKQQVALLVVNTATARQDPFFWSGARANAVFHFHLVPIL